MLNDAFLSKIEEVKRLGAYSITVTYGEGTGADDLDIPVMDRSCKLICEPVGYLGSVRAMFKGTVQEFIDFDFSTMPNAISNPPLREEYERSGFYIWGQPVTIQGILNTGKLFSFISQ